MTEDQLTDMLAVLILIGIGATALWWAVWLIRASVTSLWHRATGRAKEYSDGDA